MLCDLTQDGRMHDGLDDALNTAKLIRKLELNPEYQLICRQTLTEEECAAVEEALAEWRAQKGSGRRAGRKATSWLTAAMAFCTLAGLAAAGIAFYERRSLSLILGILAGTAFGAAALYGLREILRIAREIYGDWQKNSLEKK